MHELPKRRKKFITLGNHKVGENALYIIHGMSRLAYHKYKAAVLAGRINGMHGNARNAWLQIHTIQAEANFMIIIHENEDHMPNEFGNIDIMRVNNLLILLVALNWDHMTNISNSISHLVFFIVK